MTTQHHQPLPRVGNANTSALQATYRLGIAIELGGFGFPSYAELAPDPLQGGTSTAIKEANHHNARTHGRLTP